ncbi:glutathione S-transferase family protein [Zhongshania sp.]|uniref:glutathione S-transferase family protein n=1 Tax=Zhongshania sp. TaxID=1971902 RepID=UPI003564F601
MLKLYGFAVSNYFNMVKHAMLYKGLQFDEVTTFPGADPAYINKSPMGKVPCIETAQGCLTETSVILNYLEAAYPEKPLLPTDAFQRAKVNEIMKVAELYIELPARRLFPEVLAGKVVSDAIKAESRETLSKGCKALAALVQLPNSPYVAGENMTMADIVLRYALITASMSAKAIYSWDLVAEVPGMADWNKRMAELEISTQLDKASQEGMAAFLQAVKGK